MQVVLCNDRKMVAVEEFLKFWKFRVWLWIRFMVRVSTSADSCGVADVCILLNAL